MTIIEITRKAEAMDLPETSALLARGRFLKKETIRLAGIVDDYANYTGTPENEAVARELAWLASDDFMKVARERVAISRKINGVVNESRLTDSMIEVARSYPIERVVSFHRGLAPCFAHEDKKPSMSHWKGGNKASCFVCNKRWSAIDVVMQRDGRSFPDAVRFLCNS